MSELQEIGVQVSSVAHDMLGHAQELAALGQRLKQAAGQTAASARGGEGDSRGAQQAAQALENAARYCHQAAQHLVSGKQAAESFVAMHVGGGQSSASLAPASEGNPWAGSRFGLGQSPTASGGINLLPLTDRAGALASELSGVPGYTDVVIHGNPQEFGTRDGPPMTAEDLARVISNTSELAERPIRLLSCSVGKLDEGAAQQLADALGQPVLAPTDVVHLVGRPGNVRMVVGPNPSTNSGTWRTFHPRRG